MRVIKRLIAISIVVLAFVFAGLGFTPTTKEVQARSLIQLKPEITAKIPHNFDLARHPSIINAVVVNDFAWRVFVALNWPADSQQGTPLSDKKIGQEPDAPRVWEFYCNRDQVLRPVGEAPIVPTKSFTCPDNHKLTVRLTEAGKVTEKDKFNAAVTAVSSSPPDEKGELTIPHEEIDAGNQIPLVDQQGNYVINEIRISPDEFAQIFNNKWYDADNLEQFNDSDKKFEFVCSEYQSGFTGFPCSNYGQNGAIEIKAAWRVFDEPKSEEERSRYEKEKARYYTTKRQLSIPAEISVTGQPLSQEVEVGLIGFHIAHKTSEQGWIWSTFEQVDNVPADTSTQERYTLFNPNCKENCEENHPYVELPYLWREDAPHAVTKVGNKIENQLPSQIVRLTETNPSFNKETLDQIKKQTDNWQQALKSVSDSSVWQYYKLIGTEWLESPDVPYNSDDREITPAKPALANVALEPYFQGVSCIACHTSASLPNQAYADFSFLMGK